MRVRAHVDAVAGAELGRAHVVEEDERPDHAALRRGQGASHRESPDVAGARHDHAFERVAGMCVAGKRILSGKEAHGSTSGSASFRFVSFSPRVRFGADIDGLRGLMQTGAASGNA